MKQWYVIIEYFGDAECNSAWETCRTIELDDREFDWLIENTDPGRFEIKTLDDISTTFDEFKQYLKEN